MINQMGNNNVSGQQEEEKSSAVETQEKITQEVVNGDELRVEKDDKNLLEKVEELAPDDSLIQNETTNGKAAKDNTEEVGVEDLVAQATEINRTEEELTENLVVHTTEAKFEHPVQPLEVLTESSDEASPVNESQTVPSSKHSSDGETLLELNLEKHVFEAGDPKTPQQLSVGRETEADEVEGSNSVTNANFTSDVILDPKSDDQHEPEPVGSQSEAQGEDLSVVGRAGELLELNLSNQNQDKVHLIDDRTAEHLDVSHISDTSNQDMGKTINEDVEERNISQEGVFLETISINEEKHEQLWVNEEEKGSTMRETEPDFSSDLRDKGDKIVDSSEEVSEIQDKSIVLTEERKGAGNESENEEGVYDYVASQPEKQKASYDREENAKENASDSNSGPEMENASQIEDDKINKVASLVGNDADQVSKKFEDVTENEPEVRTVVTVIEPNQEQEKSSEAGLGVGIETNEETTRNQVDLRRSPSFDFDLSLGARYEDSDQTPLLCHDKAATRSMSSRDILTFQTTALKNHYGRNQAVEVEEKTIRMERSDSDKPRAPFMSLLKKEGNVNAFVELKQEEAPLNEQAVVNSARGSGKRRPRASLFTTCICCAASMP